MYTKKKNFIDTIGSRDGQPLCLDVHLYTEIILDIYHLTLTTPYKNRPQNAFEKIVYVASGLVNSVRKSRRLGA